MSSLQLNLLGSFNALQDGQPIEKMGIKKYSWFIPMAKKDSPTPMMEQYLKIKKNYQDAVLFFRLGDFYEMFYEDAKLASPILEIALTSRQKVPMCGVPYHAADSYLAKLLRKGLKVAICEQVEDPSTAKGIVKREVTRILTPATALEIDTLSSDLNNFIISVYKNEQSIAMASIDLSVSECEVRNFGN